MFAKSIGKHKKQKFLLWYVAMHTCPASYIILVSVAENDTARWMFDFSLMSVFLLQLQRKTNHYYLQGSNVTERVFSKLDRQIRQ